MAGSSVFSLAFCSIFSEISMPITVLACCSRAYRQCQPKPHPRSSTFLSRKSGINDWNAGHSPAASNPPLGTVPHHFSTLAWWGTVPNYCPQLLVLFHKVEHHAVYFNFIFFLRETVSFVFHDKVFHVASFLFQFGNNLI